MNEHDIQLYSKRAKAGECFLGATYWHREIVPQQLGLRSGGRVAKSVLLNNPGTNGFRTIHMQFPELKSGDQDRISTIR
jgi:hypothetical protein